MMRLIIEYYSLVINDIFSTRIFAGAESADASPYMSLFSLLAYLAMWSSGVGLGCSYSKQMMFNVFAHTKIQQIWWRAVHANGEPCS